MKIFMQNKEKLIWLGVCLLAVFIIYGRTLAGDFVFDDRGIVDHQYLLSDLNKLDQVLMMPYFTEAAEKIGLSLKIPPFIIGASIIASWLRTKTYVVILPVLILAFMFSSGIAYQICGIPREVILKIFRLRFQSAYLLLLQACPVRGKAV